jgi:hypothetical protein
VAWRPSGHVTITVTSPAAAAGVTAVSVVSLFTMAFVAGRSPKVTVTPLAKLVPVIVTVVPPVVGPLAGSIRVAPSVGGGVAAGGVACAAVEEGATAVGGTLGIATDAVAAGAIVAGTLVGVRAAWVAVLVGVAGFGVAVAVGVLVPVAPGVTASIT